jgi:hypothetical protein
LVQRNGLIKHGKHNKNTMVNFVKNILIIVIHKALEEKQEYG